MSNEFKIFFFIFEFQLWSLRIFQFTRVQIIETDFSLAEFNFLTCTPRKRNNPNLKTQSLNSII